MRPLVLAAVLCLIAPPVHAQDTSALINQALDKQVKLDLNATLPRALEEIDRQTGVRLRADQSVWDVLPWGQETNITAKIENQTLREALAAITRRLGLTFSLKDEYVEIQPHPALRRTGRRSTVKELELLNLLADSPANLGTDRPTVRQLIDGIDKRLVELKPAFKIDNHSESAVKPDQVIFVARNSSLLDVLESLTKDTALTWYPWGEDVMIVPKQDQVRMQLSKTITTRYSGVDVAQVLMELSQRAGVPFEIEPGAIQRIPVESRNIRLTLTNASIQQALETIAGFTGLGFVARDNGVYIWNQQNTPAPGQRDRAIGILTLPDIGLQVLLPESQVPPDLREYIRFKTQKELDKLRHLMKEENFTPATRPAAPGTPATEER